jgi:hypothetical protein
VGNVRALVEFQLGVQPAEFLTNRLNDSGASVDGHVTQLRAIDQVFGGRHDGTVDGEISLLGKSSVAIVEPLTSKLRGELKRWIMRHVDEPAHRLAGARSAAQHTCRHLGESLAQLQQLQAALATRIDQLGKLPGDGRSVPTSAEIVSDYFHSCLDRLSNSAALHVVRTLLSDAKAVSDEMNTLGREISHIATAVGRLADSRESQSPSEERLTKEVNARMSDISAQVDARLQTEYLDPMGGLTKTIMEGGRPRAQLTATLHELSRRAVHQVVAGVNVLETSAHGAIGSGQDNLRTSLALATPTLLEFGGRRRTLAVLPHDSAETDLQMQMSQQLGTAVTTIRGVDSSLSLCVEADGLSLKHVALEIVERRRDRVEFAGRVHCRTDIAWMPLFAPSAPADSTIWPTDAGRAQAQQAMSKTVVL